MLSSHLNCFESFPVSPPCCLLPGRPTACSQLNSQRDPCKTQARSCLFSASQSPVAFPASLRVSQSSPNNLQGPGSNLSWPSCPHPHYFPPCSLCSSTLLGPAEYTCTTRLSHLPFAPSVSFFPPRVARLQVSLLQTYSEVTFLVETSPPLHPRPSIFPMLLPLSTYCLLTTYFYLCILFIVCLPHHEGGIFSQCHIPSIRSSVWHMADTQ